MGEESAFLSAIRQTPAEETTRLVYADWLDEQGDPESTSKAEFIRLEVRMAAAPEQSLNRVRWLTKLQKLAITLNPRWLAVVSHPKLEACRVSFRFECPKQWEKLAPTENDKVRFCKSCKQHVHYCDTIQEAQNHAARGRCVAVTLALIRRCDDLYQPRPIVPGRPAPLTPEMIEQLPVAGRLDLPVIDADPRAAPLFVPPIRRQWDPAPEPEPTRPRRRTRRPGKDRARNRNIQRQDWEEE